MFQIVGIDGNSYNLSKSSHVYDKRNTSIFHRDEFISDSSYKKIIKLAIKNGLTSFRGKGAVVVSFTDYKGRIFSILVILDRYDLKNDIFVITVFKGSKDFPFYRHFINVHNRIWLSPEKFVLPYMSYEKRQKQKLAREEFLVDVACISEDNDFKKFAKNSKIKKIK